MLQPIYIHKTYIQLILRFGKNDFHNFDSKVETGEFCTSLLSLLI